MSFTGDYLFLPFCLLFLTFLTFDIASYTPKFDPEIVTGPPTVGTTVGPIAVNPGTVETREAEREEERERERDE